MMIISMDITLQTVAACALFIARQIHLCASDGEYRKTGFSLKFSSRHRLHYYSRLTFFLWFCIVTFRVRQATSIENWNWNLLPSFAFVHIFVLKMIISFRST